MNITTAALAKICSVSQGTVDRALNNRPDIKAETKQKIIKAAKQYGYRENIENDTKAVEGLVGIIIFNLNNEYFSRLVTEIEYALRKVKLGTVVMMSHYNREYEIECKKNMHNMGVKGIIICAVNSGAEFNNFLKMADIPICAVGNDILSVPYVGIDDFKAMRELTSEILKEDYENIIYFSPALNYADAFAQQRRYEGFLNSVGEKEYTVCR